jgi:GTPase involved in cell partitioning and DNA repair
MHRQGFIIDFLSHLENNNVPYEVIKYYTVEQVSPLSAYSILNGRVRQYMEENYGC